MEGWFCRGGDQTPLFGELGHKCPCARSQNFICVLPLNILPAPATRGRIQGSSCRWDGPRSPGCPLGVPWGQGRGCASALTLGRGQCLRVGVTQDGGCSPRACFQEKAGDFIRPVCGDAPGAGEGDRDRAALPAEGTIPVLLLAAADPSAPSPKGTRSHLQFDQFGRLGVPGSSGEAAPGARQEPARISEWRSRSCSPRAAPSSDP